MQELIQVDKKEATKVLVEVDTLLHKVEEASQQASECFIDLSFLLLKVKQGAFWTERGFSTEHEYIEKVFTQSRAQYYAFIRFAINLGSYDRVKLKKWGRSKCEDLVRLHVHFDGDVPDSWFEYLDSDNKETLRRRVREYLDSKDQAAKSVTSGGDKQTKESPSPETEDSYVTLRIFGNGIHTFNLAMDTSAKILGSDKSIGYRVENICANWNSQFADDGTGHVMGKNSYLLATIEGLIKQLDFKIENTSEMLIGVVAKAVENNVAT